MFYNKINMQLRLISANIRYENSHDGINSWANRRPILSKIISNYFPDILATQEGLESQIKNLAQDIPMKLVESHRQWLPERMYPCLYINEEQIVIKRSGDIWLSETPYTPGTSSFKSMFPRLFTWMQITHLVAAQDYFVVNTHLDHILGSTRIEQVKVLLAEIEKLNTKNLPLILMGDFNESPFGKVRETIIGSTDLKDPWHEEGGLEESSHHGFRSDDVKGDRIDWILIPKAFSVEEIYLDKFSSDGVFPSDHYPLLATVIPR